LNQLQNAIAIGKTQWLRDFLQANLPELESPEINLNTHLFRAVYATIASYWYCPPTVPEMEFRAAIEGHYEILDAENPELRRSLASERHYFDYKIADGSGNIDGRLGIRLHLPGVEVIEQFAASSRPLLGRNTLTSNQNSKKK
jgi:hypothetical protein